MRVRGRGRRIICFLIFLNLKKIPVDNCLIFQLNNTTCNLVCLFVNCLMAMALIKKKSVNIYNCADKNKEKKKILILLLTQFTLQIVL